MTLWFQRNLKQFLFLCSFIDWPYVKVTYPDKISFFYQESVIQFFSFTLLSNIKSNIFPTALEIYVKFELPLKLWVRTPTKLSEAAEMSQGNQFPWEPLYWFCSHYLIVFEELEKWSSSVVWFWFLEPVCKSHSFNISLAHKIIPQF